MTHVLLRQKYTNYIIFSKIADIEQHYFAVDLNTLLQNEFYQTENAT